jgi:Fe-Mn family superoxide dismutase
MHQLPALPYAFNALEPHIDARTMEIHHDKHHATYIANLNKALEGHADLQGKSVDDLLRGLASLPESIRGAVRNNGGGPRQSHDVLGNHGSAGRTAVGRAGAGHRLDLRRPFRPAGKGERGSGRPVRIRLGLARLERRASSRSSREPNQDSPLSEGKDAPSSVSTSGSTPTT